MLVANLAFLLPPCCCQAAKTAAVVGSALTEVGRQQTNPKNTWLKLGQGQAVGQVIHKQDIRGKEKITKPGKQTRSKTMKENSEILAWYVRWKITELSEYFTKSECTECA